MLKEKLEVKDKISHRMKQHFSHLRSIFNGKVVTRNNSHSGVDGRFSLIYKLFFNESSYVGFRFKKDSLNSYEQSIQFYVVRILQKSTLRSCPSKKIISFSREVSVLEFIDLMKEMLSIETKESFVRIMNEKSIFSFDLKCCLISLNDFNKSFMNEKIIEEQFQIIREIEKSNNLNLSKVEDKIADVNNLLQGDEEYQELLKQKKLIEDKIKKKEENATLHNNEKNVAEKVKNLIDYFNSSLTRIERVGHPEVSKYTNTLHLIKEMGDRLNKLNLHEKKIHTFEDDLILKNELSFEMFDVK